MRARNYVGMYASTHRVLPCMHATGPSLLLLYRLRVPLLSIVRWLDPPDSARFTTNVNSVESAWAACWQVQFLLGFDRLMGAPCKVSPCCWTRSYDKTILDGIWASPSLGACSARRRLAYPDEVAVV